MSCRGAYTGSPSRHRLLRRRRLRRLLLDCDRARPAGVKSCIRVLSVQRCSTVGGTTLLAYFGGNICEVVPTPKNVQIALRLVGNNTHARIDFGAPQPPHHNAPNAPDARSELMDKQRTPPLLLLPPLLAMNPSPVPPPPPPPLLGPLAAHSDVLGDVLRRRCLHDCTASDRRLRPRRFVPALLLVVESNVVRRPLPDSTCAKDQSREQRAEIREQRAESRAQRRKERAHSRAQSAESREHQARPSMCVSAPSIEKASVGLVLTRLEELAEEP